MFMAAEHEVRGDLCLQQGPDHLQDSGALGKWRHMDHYNPEPCLPIGLGEDRLLQETPLLPLHFRIGEKHSFWRIRPVITGIQHYEKGIPVAE